MEERIYLYPLWIRLWHLLNALCILGLIITGVSMQYSDPDTPFIKFDVAVTMHNVCGILLTINYVYFFLGNIISKNGKYYDLHVDLSPQNIVKQMRYYLVGMFKGEKVPFPVNEQRKFNPLQKIAYILVMYVAVPALIITGWGLLYPDAVLDRLLGLNGVLVTDILHVIVGFVVSIFLLVHVYFCTLGKKPGTLFKSMATGWHESRH